MPNVVVLGAGVSGLTTAFLLAQSKKYQITIIAKHMPGDYDIEYTSPWAGADFVPVMKRTGLEGPERELTESYERATWPELARLARDVPESGVAFQRLIRYRREKDADRPAEEWLKDGWFRYEMPDFRFLTKDELPSGIDAGISVTSVCINVPIYLSWLVSQCMKLGVVIQRGIIEDITDLPHLAHADVIINCTGLSSLRLQGVADSNLYPSRGQTVLIRNTPSSPSQRTMYSISGTDDGPDERAYIMHRPGGGGCILGGCTQKGKWDSQADPNLAVRIMKRCVELDPSLVPQGQGIEALSVVRHGVGLRPMRVGGVRVKREVLERSDGKEVCVVHNYGHGGGGYQMSYGTAKEAVRLVEEK